MLLLLENLHACFIERFTSKQKEATVFTFNLLGLDKQVYYRAVVLADENNVHPDKS